MNDAGARPEADPDLDLVRRTAQGDRRAGAALVDRHLARVHRLAGRTLGNTADAEEVAQEVFLRVWEQAPRWRPGAAKFSTWLYRVTLNACRDRMRRRREHGVLEEAELVSSEATPEQRAAELERIARLRTALDALPERQREALLLCHHEAMSQIEAAAVLDVSVEALESLLARGRRRLRDLLTGETP